MSGSVRHVGIHEAKTHLSSLLREVEQGEEIVVTRGGKAVARIVAMQPGTSPSSSYGLFEGQFELRDDFDADSDELADLFGVPE